MSDTNRVVLGWREEAAYGVFDSGALQKLRFTGESVGEESETDTSKEIRDDGQVPDVQRMFIHTAGDINGELSYGTYDSFLRYGLRSGAWAGGATVTGTIYSVTAGSGQFTITRSSGDFTSGQVFAANQWVRIRGFATAANNGYAKIVSVTTTTLVVKALGSGVNEAAGATVTIEQGEQIVNGTTLKSFSLQKQFADLSNVYVHLLGQMVSGMNFGFGAGEFVTISFNLMGKTGQTSTSPLNATLNATNTNAVMQGVDNVAKAMIDFVDGAVSKFTESITNNLRERKVAGLRGPESLGSGRHVATGTITRYFATKAQYDAYLNFTKSNLAFIFDDHSGANVGNAYIVEHPSVKFTKAKPSATAADADTMLDLDFTAQIDATELITTRIVRFPAA
ncbi:MAG: hypothetical protein KF805_08430 [Phycisphaeraceae bacterium]|nr:hypothetical protein [Phycisphaeraceae bacterium]